MVKTELIEHSIFLSDGPEDFARRFKDATGLDIGQFAAGVAKLEFVEAIIVTGSIPLRIGGPRSDIDFFFLTENSEAHVEEDPPNGFKLLFKGRPAGGELSLSFYEKIFVVSGVEIDVHFVDLPAVRETAAALARGGTYLSLTGPSTMILSRIKSGWCVWQRQQLGKIDGGLTESNALEIHCAVRYMSFALQDLDDAVGALSNDPQLSLFLGRVAVEKAFLSYFASRGIAFAGTKWLRFLRSDRMDLCTEANQELKEQGLALLFPSSDDVGNQSFLREATAFISKLQRLTFASPSLAMAFRLCPQLYDPYAKE